MKSEKPFTQICELVFFLKEIDRKNLLPAEKKNCKIFHNDRPRIKRLPSKGRLKGNADSWSPTLSATRRAPKYFLVFNRSDFKYFSGSPGISVLFNLIWTRLAFQRLTNYLDILKKY